MHQRLSDANGELLLGRMNQLRSTGEGGEKFEMALTNLAAYSLEQNRKAKAECRGGA